MLARRFTFAAVGIPAMAIAGALLPAAPAAAATAGGTSVSGWPTDCSYSRMNATQGRARCFKGGGFYRVVLICNSTGRPVKLAFGPWRLPGGITKPDSVGTCPGDYTVSPGDVGVESKPD